jgi:hypothetical protein
MRYIYLIFCMMLAVSFPVESYPEDKTSESDVNSAPENNLANIMSSEYAIYIKSLSGDKGLDDAKAAIHLMQKTKELRNSLPLATSDDGQKKENVIYRSNVIWAYEIAWSKCLRVYNYNAKRLTERPKDDNNDNITLEEKEKAEAVKKLILDEWNKSLKEGDKCVASQANAIGIEWNPDFLTNDLWKLLQTTKNYNVFLALCRAITNNGDEKDVNRLSEIVHTLKYDPEQQFSNAAALYVMQARGDRKLKDKDGQLWGKSPTNPPHPKDE